MHNASVQDHCFSFFHNQIYDKDGKCIFDV